MSTAPDQKCLNVVVVVVAAPESHLVSGGSDNRLIVWEAQNGKVSRLLHPAVFSWLSLKIST